MTASGGILLSFVRHDQLTGLSVDDSLLAALASFFTCWRSVVPGVGASPVHLTIHLPGHLNRKTYRLQLLCRTIHSFTCLTDPLGKPEIDTGPHTLEFV